MRFVVFFLLGWLQVHVMFSIDSDATAYDLLDVQLGGRDYFWDGCEKISDRSRIRNRLAVGKIEQAKTVRVRPSMLVCCRVRARERVRQLY